MGLVRLCWLLLITVLPAGPAMAAAPKASRASSSALSASVAEQKKQIDEQQKLIENQQKMIDAQASRILTQTAVADSQTVQIERQQEQLAAMNTLLADMKKRLDALESQANFPAWEDSLEKRMKQVEASAQKTPEMPPDVVSAGDFPGSIRIPGSDAAIKFGGRVRTAAVFTFDPLGTDDRFLANSIPVGVTTVSGEDKRTNISARASRLNIEFRTPTGAQELRAFFEGDFAGAGNAFRLRHAYAQYRGFIVGQTWSTFSDPWVGLEDLDFEGVSSENIIRQPLIRYWWNHAPTTRLAVAIETPSVSITNGQGVNLVPDMIARGYWGGTEGGHIQIAGVLRQIRGESTSGVVRSQWGGGASFSGVGEVPVQSLTDRIMFQINGGWGIARYINDLNSAGGMDAVFDTTTNTLEVIPALGWYVGYEHQWKEWKSLETMNLRSTILWSIVLVDNPGFQPPDAYRRTNRVAGNLVFSPSPRGDVGIEYIYGTRLNKDGEMGHANQFQFVTIFRF
jgi:DcaP outer membrane protein